MQAGNRKYREPADFPDIIPVFPLAGALLLPGGNLPLNIFEPRYMAMIDDALASHRLIGMIQPDLSGKEGRTGPELCQMGCIGRLTGFQETGDGRYLINLSGVCRFTPVAEVEGRQGYRNTRISIAAGDLSPGEAGSPIDRDKLLETFRRYLEVNSMETDWEAVERTDDETLVTALCMMSPYGPAEKQALLEADCLRERAETLIAITEISLAREDDSAGPVLQ